MLIEVGAGVLLAKLLEGTSAAPVPMPTNGNGGAGNVIGGMSAQGGDSMVVNGAQLAQLIDNLRAQTMLTEQFKSQPQLRIEDQGFFDLPIDLSDARLSANGLDFPSLHGFEVTYLRRASTPGGLLTLNVAGMTQPLGVGDFFTGRFDSLTVKLAAGSVTAGTAILRVVQNPQLHFRESPASTIPVSPVALLGTFSAGVPTFATLQLKDLIPSGAQAGSFSISGWSTIVVLVDTTSNAGTATSFDLVPYYQPVGGTLWFEQGTERISVPDTSVSGGQYRVIVIPLNQAQGQLYLAIQNLLAAARTGLSFCVLGVQ